MRVSSLDLILMKVLRVQIEILWKKFNFNYFDMINYSVFAMIHLN